jgi:AcrR family transcriptional regulator
MVYRKTAKVESQLADKRQRILEAALQLVVQGGFNEAPVSAIAALAGVATGTVYRYFSAKTTLLAEVVSTVSQHEFDVIAAEAAHEGSAAERLERALRRFSSRALKRRRLAYALMAEPLDSEIDEIRLLYRRKLGSIYEALINQGIGSREFPRQNAATSAACIVGACTEALAGPVAIQDGASPREREALIDDIVAFALGAVRAPRPATAPGG